MPDRPPDVRIADDTGVRPIPEIDSDVLTRDEIVRRRDAALRRALNTPPTQRKDDKVRARPSKPKQAKKPT